MMYKASYWKGKEIVVLAFFTAKVSFPNLQDSVNIGSTLAETFRMAELPLSEVRRRPRGIRVPKLKKLQVSSSLKEGH
jgi:hypothetical protein